MAYWSPFGPVRKDGTETPYFPNCGQMNSCPFVRTLQERAKQDKQMEQKADTLRSREKQLQQEENRLKREKYVIQEEKQRLNRQKEALNQQEARVNRQQNDLSLKQFELTRREHSLADRENQLLRDRGALKILEHQIAAREKALADREEALKGSEVQLKETAEICRRERHLLEEIKNSCVSGSGVNDTMQEVRNTFLTLGNELKATQQKLRNLIVAVDYGPREGISHLCRLHREMVFSDNPQVRLLADRLKMILQASFEAVPLEPRAGDLYDSTCHERIDTARSGSAISRCRALGWRWKDEILMRSVVETRERDEIV